MIPQETVDRILDLAQVEDVIGDFVTLKRAGATYKACCPFHNEKTPSFVVSPSKGIYKCFGCGKSGTAVGFVMEHENMTYVEALKYLAKKYNIEVIEKEETAEDIANRQRTESLLLVSEYAGKFFGLIQCRRRCYLKKTECFYILHHQQGSRLPQYRSMFHLYHQ